MASKVLNLTMHQRNQLRLSLSGPISAEVLISKGQKQGPGNSTFNKFSGDTSLFSGFFKQMENMIQELPVSEIHVSEVQSLSSKWTGSRLKKEKCPRHCHLLYEFFTVTLTFILNLINQIGSMLTVKFTIFWIYLLRTKHRIIKMNLIPTDCNLARWETEKYQNIAGNDHSCFTDLWKRIGTYNNFAVTWGLMYSWRAYLWTYNRLFRRWEREDRLARRGKGAVLEGGKK